MGVLGQLPEHIEELKDDLMNSKILFGTENFGLTNFIFWMCIACVVLLLLILISNKKLKLVPNNKFVNFVEFLYEFVRNKIGKETIGPGYKKHIPFLAAIFFFILIANFIGLIPGAKAATGTISVTWALAIISFVYFNYWGVKVKGGLGYLKGLVPDGVPIIMAPVLFILEVVSTCLRAVTLAFRLYGNMFAGHLVLGIFAVLTSVFVTYSIQNAQYVLSLPSIGWLAFLVAMYTLEVLVAFLQAYVFTILSAVYISSAISKH